MDTYTHLSQVSIVKIPQILFQHLSFYFALNSKHSDTIFTQQSFFAVIYDFLHDTDHQSTK